MERRRALRGLVGSERAVLGRFRLRQGAPLLPHLVRHRLLDDARARRRALGSG
jgi:hypothetical protein